MRPIAIPLNEVELAGGQIPQIDADQHDIRRRKVQQDVAALRTSAKLVAPVAAANSISSV